MTERVALFLDFQNIHLVGHGLFEKYGTPPYSCVPDPCRITDLIERRRAGGRMDPRPEGSHGSAIEAIKQLRLGHIEVACWSGHKPLRLSNTQLPYCHFLNSDDWAAATEDWTGRV